MYTIIKIIYLISLIINYKKILLLKGILSIKNHFDNYSYVIWVWLQNNIPVQVFTFIECTLYAFKLMVSCHDNITIIYIIYNQIWVFLKNIELTILPY